LEILLRICKLVEVTKEKTRTSKIPHFSPETTNLVWKNSLLMSLRKKIPPFSQIFLKGEKVPNNQ
jgi:hypothetical protein